MVIGAWSFVVLTGAVDSWVCINSPISGTCYPNGVPFSFLPDLPCLHHRVGFGEVLGAPRMMGQYGLDLGPVCLLICASTCLQGRQGTIPLGPSGTLPKPCKGDPCSCLSSWEFWAVIDCYDCCVPRAFQGSSIFPGPIFSHGPLQNFPVSGQ